MQARYNKGLEHCVEIYDSNKAMVMKVSDAKALVESMNKAIAEAERDYERERDELLKLSKEALVDLIIHRPTPY